MIEAMEQALEALEKSEPLVLKEYRDQKLAKEWYEALYKHRDSIKLILQAIADLESQKPVAWLQFKENESPVVAPRGLGTPVFFGIRGGLAHDAQNKEENNA